MKIALVWKNDYPWDIRIEKVSKTLFKKGHEIFLICNNIKKRKIYEDIDGIHVHRLKPIKNNFLNKIVSIPAFFNPIWIYNIYKVVKYKKIDLIIVRDIPLTLAGIMVGKLFKIPVMCDMAENYSAMWKDVPSRRGINFYNIFLKNPKIAEITEHYSFKWIDHVLVVVEESKKNLVSKQVPEYKISIVSNTPDINVLANDNNPDSTQCNKLFVDRFVLLYIGFVDKGRGLDTAINSLPMLKDNIKNILLVIVGDGYYLNYLKTLAKKLDIEDYIECCGWKDFRKIPAYIKSSDICIIPHVVGDHVNNTIPNKLFDYMACRKPVIVSDGIPLKRIVNQTLCGLVFTSGNPQDFAGKVIYLSNSEKRKLFGENGFKAVMNKYNWSRDSEILVSVVEKLGYLKEYE